MVGEFVPAGNGVRPDDPSRAPDLGAVSLGDRIRAWAALRILATTNAMLAALRFCLWPRQPRVVERIGVYRIGNIGDIVCALPALNAIRRTYPHARLTLVTSAGNPSLPGAKDILAGADWIDELMTYESARGAGWVDLLRQIRHHRFDLWIVLPPAPASMRRQLRDMIAARVAGVRWGYGWRLDVVRFWRRAQSRLLVFPNEVEWLMSIVRNAGVRADEYAFPLPLDGAAARVESLLREHPGILARPLVAIATGAKHEIQRWPVERFAEVAAALSARGFAVVALGGSGDAAVCTHVASAAGTLGLNLAGRTSILESCEVLRRSRLLICNDSGVQHLAAAVGTPCVSIFSFRNHTERWLPYGKRNVVLKKWVPCAICLLESCPRDNLCLRLISSSEVLERALAQLG